MREIKFRVYDEESKSMEYEIAIGKGYGKEHYILFLGLGETFIIEDKLKVMQYTGLKDKNNVEIYEGDILNWDDDNCIKQNQEVKFEYGSFFMYPSVELLGNYYEQCTIIGNIYKNKDLLNS